MINYDNVVFNGINKAVYLAYASVLWVLFSLPVFTLGASTTALYYSVHKVIKHDTGKLFSEFWSAFKLNFKQSTVVFLLFAAILLIGVADYFVLQAYLDQGSIFKGFSVIVLVFNVGAIMIANYVFPYIARFQNTTKLILMNSVYFAITNILKTLLMLVILAVAILLVMINPVFLAVSPGVFMFCADYLIEPIFRKYMTPEDQEAERRRNEVCNDL